MNPRVKEVTPLKGFKLKLVFTDGERKIYDCSHLLNFGIFKELQNESYFKLVKPYAGTIVWPHEQDICPDTLYLDSVKENTA